MASSQLCERCSRLPLDLFLPMMTCGHAHFHNNRAWRFAVEHFPGEDGFKQLRVSCDSGCSMCRLIYTALESAEPSWATGQFKGKGHSAAITQGQASTSPRFKEPGIYLEVVQEGELLVYDTTRRGGRGGLYWRLNELDYGRDRGTVRDHADSDENFAMAKVWLQDCTAQHRLCKPISARFLPTRLVDTGSHSLEQPRLIITADMDQAPYFALSHCWGTDRGKTVTKTTHQNLASHLEGIDMENLPKTFRDAMTTVRRLGYRYIWIDSLCIVQDDKADFKHECSSMAQVYAQAVCTIAASDSPDGDGGCFIPRDRDRMQCCIRAANFHIPYHRRSLMDCIFERFGKEPEEAEVRIYADFGPWIKRIHSGAIAQRAWCLQEREMSPRVLYFTCDRLMWECRESTASEDEPALKSKTLNQGLSTYLSSARALDTDKPYTMTVNKAGVVMRIDKWQMLAENFSRRRLSVPKDKLVAISGLAATVAKLHHPLKESDHYLAGVWRGNLLQDISWFPDINKSSPTSPDEWPPASGDPGIPSWSWAAHDGPVKFRGETWYSYQGPFAQVENASVTRAENDPFGRVSGGELVLSGWGKELKLSENDSLPVGYVHRDMLARVWDFPSKCYTLEPGLVIYFDNDVHHLKEIEIVCLQLGVGRNVRGNCPKADVGLVLLPVMKGKFRRVGMFDVTVRREEWRGAREIMKVNII